jgi:hypothetical protein
VLACSGVGMSIAGNVDLNYARRKHLLRSSFQKRIHTSTAGEKRFLNTRYWGINIWSKIGGSYVTPIAGTDWHLTSQVYALTQGSIVYVFPSTSWFLPKWMYMFLKISLSYCPVCECGCVRVCSAMRVVSRYATQWVLLSILFRIWSPWL